MIVRFAEGKKWERRALVSASLILLKKAWMRALMAFISGDSSFMAVMVDDQECERDCFVLIYDGIEGRR